ncbi:beta-glucanase (GH16 family) [Hymenobacter luteus]|uniref:Beta-glucanase (GH16 family) n=2 Tax=Hymenobacter TaxID=89966 RepID=A0A7W9T3W8_9BACT|nr:MULTISPECIES: glycoside hydrolase family 16 protein [Hymenobacter]MBB4603301.1 beta-glucanase (GH16 family) [Hymenobacter latericoloratus]MBB6061141.1 beta-glucanase (GH16 family) [Hymenobacter luteus]
MKNLPLSGQQKHQFGAALLLSLSLLSCTETKTKNVPAPTPPKPTTPVVNEEARDYAQYTELIWKDEFDGGTIDQTKWTHELGASGWGNNELQNYTNSTDNSYLRNGMLVIQAQKQTTGSNAYTSARLITKGKQSFQYGRIDVRAKIPKGKGVWPAIWMLGADIDQNNWPKCGEIDIMELRGSRPTELISTMHYANSMGVHEYKGTTQNLSEDLSADFHTYSVVRSKNLTRFYLDGSATPYYTFSATDASPFPFNNPFFVILNVAVGGNFDGNPDGSTTFPQQMQVDYVRYYQYK